MARLVSHQKTRRFQLFFAYFSRFFERLEWKLGHFTNAKNAKNACFLGYPGPPFGSFWGQNRPVQGNAIAHF